MSDAIDATNAMLREKGILPPESPDAPAESSSDAPPELAPIRLPGRNVPISQFSRELGAVLCRNGVFLRSDMAVTLDKKHCRLVKLDSESLRSYGDDQAFLHTIEKSGEEFVKIRQSMRKDIASAVLSSRVFLEQQREVWRVNAVPMPVIRDDGRLELLEQGFDHESQILTMPSSMKYRLMPVEEAVTFFKNLTAGFPFPDRDPSTGLSHALCVHMAAWLTPFVLSMLPRQALIPMFIYSSNRQGSGKSLLVKMILYCIFGSASSIPFGTDEDELRKLLDTEALANSPFIFFDNVKRKLSSMLLDMWLTQSTWKGRRMGGQQQFEVPKQGVVYISSNHAETDKDSTRRACFCELFIEEVDISARKFTRMIDDSYLSGTDVRQDMLSALWSIVHHWDQSGRPKGPTNLGSFERWAELVGGIIHCAGFGDPLSKAEAIAAGDSDTKDMKQLVDLLSHKIVDGGDESDEAPPKEDPNTAEFNFETVIQICRDHDLFVKRIDGKDKDGTFELTRSSRIQLGKLFEREAGQIWNVPGVGKVRFGRRGSKNWRTFAVELIEAETAEM